jgi:hypothetical protein
MMSLNTNYSCNGICTTRNSHMRYTAAIAVAAAVPTTTAMSLVECVGKHCRRMQQAVQ